MDKQLEALTEAYKILGQAETECARYAALKPYAFVTHARAYIAQQADELLQPIFADESRA